jgi:hypothetical protein
VGEDAGEEILMLQDDTLKRCQQLIFELLNDIAMLDYLSQPAVKKHFLADSDLDSIRELPQYQLLIEKLNREDG